MSCCIVFTSSGFIVASWLVCAASPQESIPGEAARSLLLLVEVAVQFVAVGVDDDVIATTRSITWEDQDVGYEATVSYIVAILDLNPYVFINVLQITTFLSERLLVGTGCNSA